MWASAELRLRRESRGQSLVETAIMLPLLLLLVLNVVNLGYFFLVIVNLTASSRTATLYSIMGSATPAASVLPSSGGATPTTSVSSVTYLVFQDMTGALWNPTGASVRVCSPVNVASNSGLNGTGASLRTNCETCTSGGCGTAGAGSPLQPADPEAPNFILNQVQITYAFKTLIPGKMFNIPLQASPICNSTGNCSFIRQASMRVLGP